METYFAPAERISDSGLRAEIDLLSKNPVIDGLLGATGALLAVLNGSRQIIALNDSFLAMLGIPDAKAAFGLRPGEAINCIHADDMPGGCGTSAHCITCPAAIAIVSSLAENQPVERRCALQAVVDGRIRDLFFNVRAVPVTLEDHRFVLLFLRDISRWQQLATLERVFFHDLNNIAFSILGHSELLMDEPGCDGNGARQIRNAAKRLTNEIAFQRRLLFDEDAGAEPIMAPVSLQQVFADIDNLFRGHPAKEEKQLALPGLAPGLTVTTDGSALFRVMANMILNGLEASAAGECVRVQVERKHDRMVFSTWNASDIPLNVQKRIFQRNFSTKGGMGRGLGTFSMKHFGETVLGGQVTFTSSAEAGTTFRLTLPDRNQETASSRTPER